MGFYLIFELSEIFEALDPITKRKICTFINEAPIKDVIELLQKPSTIHNDELNKSVKERIDKFSIHEISKGIITYKIGYMDIVKTKAVKYFCEVQSWHQANDVAEKLILPLINQLTKEHILKILKTVEEKEADLIGSHGFHEFLQRLSKDKIITLPELEGIITDKDIKQYICRYFNQQESDNSHRK